MSEEKYSKSYTCDEDQPDYCNNNEEDEKETCQIEASLEYSLNNINQEAVSQLYKEYMLIKPDLNREIIIKYREILRIKGENYKICITLAKGEELIISCLGYSYEDFLRIMIQNRNELILQDMLMYESKIFLEIECEYTHYNEYDNELSGGECNVCLYETGLIIIPSTSDPFRIPYSLISRLNEDNYKLNIETDIGEKIILSSMGMTLDGFKNTYSNLIGKLDKKLQVTLLELFNDAASSSLSELPELMRDGKSVKKEELDSLSKDLWPQMENKLSSLGLEEEYNYLKAIGQLDKISIGIKKGLMGSLTGEYIWFLIPIYGLSPKLPGNIIAMEAASTEDVGRATYFFKIMDGDEYNKIQSLEELHTRVDKFIRLLNYSMLVINFRREPIYLKREQLLKPQYIKYLYSIEKQPALQLLREHFIGRAIHSNTEKWKQEVMNIIK